MISATLDAEEYIARYERHLDEERELDDEEQTANADEERYERPNCKWCDDSGCMSCLC